MSKPLALASRSYPANSAKIAHLPDDTFAVCCLLNDMATTASNVTSYKSVQISDCWLAIPMCGGLYFHDGFSDVMFCPLRYLLIVSPKFCVKHITASCLGGCSRFTSGYLLCPLDTPWLPWHQIRTGCDIAKMGLPPCRTTKISHVGRSCGIQPSFRCITPCTAFLNLRSSVHLASFPSPECGEVHVCRLLALQSAMTRNSNMIHATRLRLRRCPGGA